MVHTQEDSERYQLKVIMIVTAPSRMLKYTSLLR
jgi:hypothetical protein